MNCPNCGTANPDTASLCANCGRPLTGAASVPPPPAQSYTPPPPPSSSSSYTPPPTGQGGYVPGPAPAPPPGGAGPIVYLILSILMILCCCNPVAIVPLVFAIMAMSRRSAGDYVTADVNARRAALWFWISVVALIIWYVIFFMFLGGMATIEEIRRNLPQ